MGHYNSMASVIPLLAFSCLLAQRAELTAPPTCNTLYLYSGMRRAGRLDLAIFALYHIVFVTTLATGLLTWTSRGCTWVSAAIFTLLIHLLCECMACLLQRLGVLADFLQVVLVESCLQILNHRLNL